MDASQYKDNVLTLLFMKYVSDLADDPDSLLDVPKGGGFADMLAALPGNLMASNIRFGSRCHLPPYGKNAPSGTFRAMIKGSSLETRGDFQAINVSLKSEDGE